jgi:hypothetical protein
LDLPWPLLASGWTPEHHWHSSIFPAGFLDADLPIRLTFAIAYTLLGIVFVIFGLASNSLFALVSLSLLLGLPVNFLTVSKLLLLASSGFHAFATLAALFGLSVSFLVLAFCLTHRISA